MQVIENKTSQDLLASVIAEVAKATNELRCARGDLEKVTSRMSFVLAVVNELVQRNKDKQEQR